MKTITQANNRNNSMITVEFRASGVLSVAAEIAQKHGCGFSHNVRANAPSEEDRMPKSFGTISFNKGAHAEALCEFSQRIF